MEDDEDSRSRKPCRLSKKSAPYSVVKNPPEFAEDLKWGVRLVPLVAKPPSSRYPIVPMEDWSRELAGRIDGEVDASPLARRLYRQDASIYEEEPLGVVRPRGAYDCREIVAFALERGISLIPRAGGTSLAGQCVGRGLVVDVARHMNRILEIDPVRRLARVGPGVVQDDLNDRAAPHGLLFAPDTSTSKQAAIGGMIGNNSCGAYSILHGTTRDHVVEVEAVLGDGSLVRFGPLGPAEIEERRRRPGLEGAVHAGLLDLVARSRDAILRDFPDPRILRRNMGYALDLVARSGPLDPAGPPLNLAAFLCGSEGTLALVTEAVVRLVPAPRAKLLLAAHFGSVEEACRANVAALAHRPAAVELMDGIVLEATRANREQARNRFWIEGAPGAVLIIEFQGDAAADLEDRARALAADLRGRGLGYAFPTVGPKEMARVWALRKAGLGILTGIPGDHKPVTAIEDAAVAPEDLPRYVGDIRDLTRRHGCDCVFYGHASVGLLHLRPMLNLKDPADLARFEKILEETAALVKRYGGSLSGEHGDGRLRSPFIARMLPETHGLLAEVKRLFDPRGIFNPGKIVDPAPVGEALRTSPRSRTPEVETVFDWSRTKGLVRATEACNGAGFCRQAAGRGVMCPSHMATGEEAYTTRGRANVFRQLLVSERPDDAWTSPDLAAVLDTCLSCKGCASECPSNVDMARLKAEWLQKRIDREGASLRSKLVGNFSFFAKLARVAPRLASLASNTRLAKLLLGIAPKREVPAYARETFAAWFRRHPPGPLAGRKGEAVVFNDEFSNFTDPEVGIAAVEVLEAAGFRTRLATLDSGRTQISKGFLRSARRKLAQAVRVLAPDARRDVPIIGLEPSAILGLRDEAPDLVPEDLRADAAAVKARSCLFEEFIARRAAEGGLDLLSLAPLPEGKCLLHGHCHQKALGGTAPTHAALRLVPGLEVREIPSGCCGMAGAFGYEAEHYDLSMAVGETVLFPAIRAEPGAIVCAPGTSCRHQIRDGTGREALHPAQVLRRALAPRPE
jgi:FAD/FMN-containing dehydrogenase/Fe-S oxidoreductase